MQIPKLLNIFNKKEDSPADRPDPVVDLLLAMDKSIIKADHRDLAQQLEKLEPHAYTDELQQVLDIGIEKYREIIASKKSPVERADALCYDLMRLSTVSKIGKATRADFTSLMAQPDWTPLQKSLLCLSNFKDRGIVSKNLSFLLPFLAENLPHAKPNGDSAEFSILTTAADYANPGDALYTLICDALNRSIETHIKKSPRDICFNLTRYILANERLNKDKALCTGAVDAIMGAIADMDQTKAKEIVALYGDLTRFGHTPAAQALLEFLSKQAESAEAESAAKLYIMAIAVELLPETREITLALKAYELFLEGLVHKEPHLATQIVYRMNELVQYEYRGRIRPKETLDRFNKIHDKTMDLACRIAPKKNVMEALEIAEDNMHSERYSKKAQSLLKKTLDTIFSPNSGISSADLEKAANRYARSHPEAEKIRNKILAAQRKTMSPAAFIFRFKPPLPASILNRPTQTPE